MKYFPIQKLPSRLIVPALLSFVAMLGAQITPDPSGHVHGIASVTEVLSPEDRSRTKLGVGEIVNLTSEHYPEETITWATISGGGTLAPTSTIGEAKFTAPDTVTPGNDMTVIEARCSKGGKNRITFQTVAPSGVYMEIQSRYPKTSPLEIETHTDIYILPFDVNFEKIKVQEQDCPAIVTGYWKGTKLDGLAHFYFLNPQPPPAPMVSHVKDKGTKVKGFDRVRSTTAPKGFPYTAGTFHWDIPWKYYLDSTQKEFTTPPHIQHLASVDMISGVATLKHEKASMNDSVSRSYK